MKNKISVVIPVHNEENNIKDIARAVAKDLNKTKHNYEIIFVNDGSTDNTIAQIYSIKKEIPNVGLIGFTRHFGKEAGLLAGLKIATGSYIAVMDADFQDPPEALIKMTAILDKKPQIKIVAAKRSDYHAESGSLFSEMFYSISQKATGIKLPNGDRDFRMMRREVVNKILTLPERVRFSKYLFNWTGDQIEYIDIPDIERHAGESQWTFSKLIDYALAGIVGNSTILPKWIIYIGTGIFLLGLIGLIWSFFASMLKPLFCLMWLIILTIGIGIGCLGVVGLYAAQILVEVKQRPSYLIKEQFKPKSTKNQELK